MAASNETKILLTAEDKTAAAFGSVSRGLRQMEDQAAMATRALGAIGVTVSAAAMVAMVKGTIDAADGFNDLSQRVGINIRQLAGWTLAANQSGTSMESVAKGIKGLSTYMVDHGDRLRAAGVTATDANGAMIQLADIFKGMPDGVEKTALAVQLFGKAGMDMIPMLNLGSAGLADAQEKADAYGKRMAELAPQADRFNDQLEEMQFQLKLVGVEMASHVVGPMATWLEANNEAIRVAGGASEALRLFVFNLDAMTTEKPAEEIRRLTGALEKYQAASGLGKFAQSPTGFLFGGREDDLQKQIKFLKFLERQEAMDGAAKFGDYRDARDRSLTTGPTMARAKAMLDKPAAGVAAVKARRPFDPEGDFFYAVDESLRKKQRAQFDADEKELEGLEKKRIAMEEMAEKRMEYNRIATEGEEAIRESLEKTGKAGKDMFAGLTDAVESWGNKAADTFADFVVDGKASFGDLANSILKDIVRIQAKAWLDPKTKDAGSWLSGGIGKLFESMFAPSGAPIASQGFGMAGDAGSLLGFAGGGYTGSGARSGGMDGQGGFLAMLHPQESVIDHAQGGSGGSAVTVILNISTGVAQTVRAEISNLLPSISASVQGAVMDARLRGGATRSAYRG